VFPVWSLPRLHNESLLVAREIRELELGVQKRQENENPTAYSGVQQHGNWFQMSVGDGHGKLAVEEELEVSLWRLSM
jgi:hypothetical protein